MSESRNCCHTLCAWVGLDVIFIRCSDKPLLHLCWSLCFRSYFAPVHSARALIMTRSLTFFALCAGNEDGCPWKQARGASLDTDSGRRCPFCDRASLRLAMASRNGQEVTSALRMIESASAELYIAALGRLESMEGAQLAADFRARVERSKRRGTQRALRRPAAAPEAAAPADSEG